jgi:membrane-associated phospholipid phosphatase
MRSRCASAAVVVLVGLVGLVGPCPAAWSQSLASTASGERAASQPASLDSTIAGLPSPSAPGVPNLFKSTLTDFGNLKSIDSLTWLTIGTLASTFTHPADAGVTARVSTSEFAEGFRSGNIIGGAEFQFGTALAAYGIGHATGSRRITDVAGKVFRAQLLAQTMTGVAKFTAHRTRPDGSDQRSFPSGHTSVTFASATVLQRELGWKVGVPAYAVAAYVATARIEKKKHYLSDVAMGAAIGVLAGRTVTVGHGDKRFALVPTATTSGAALNFTWIGN